MRDTSELRSALAGLLSFAAAEEQALLAADAFHFHPGDDRGTPDRWAAVPVVAHNNQFKGQQAERVSAIRAGQVPAVFGEVDHASAEVYRGYLGAPAAAAGMAGYSLACAQAQAGQPDQAARTLAEAIEANPDLLANASRDPDLRVLREASP